MVHQQTNLASYNIGAFHRGRSNIVFGLWIIIDSLLVSSWIPGSRMRRMILRLFGAKIGKGVVFKPSVRVKFPWRLSVGDYSWIGENVWIDNLAEVNIGSHACLSQGAYLCTGSHNWSAATFDLITQPITICDGAWIAAKSTVGPGVTIGEGAVLGLGSTTSQNLEAWNVYVGAPAQFVKNRTINSTL